MRNKIGVIGCLPELPVEFPVIMPENSGNMIHAQAPLRMFSNSVYSKDGRFKWNGAENFKAFVNQECSHLIVTLANTLSLDKPDEDRYRRFRVSLEQYDVPIIVFGFGIQKKDLDLNNAKLGPEAIKLVEFLSERASLLGVRGEFTKKVIENSTSVKNVFVTGCPSFFSRPEAFSELHGCIKNLKGRPSLNLTNMARDSERKLLAYGLLNEHFYIEPVSRITHEYVQRIAAGEETSVPYYWNGIIKNGYIGEKKYSDIATYYQKYYRLFRQVEPWLQFNSEFVSFTYGTRFHVNMAALLSGKPALWVVHDARTKELTDFYGLPAVDLDFLAENINSIELDSLLDYGNLFNRLPWFFKNFNEYLLTNGLPRISLEYPT